MTPLNDIRSSLGEGAFWHPIRQEFFWFDITGQKLHSLVRTWEFPEMASAMGWISQQEVLIGTEQRLLRFNLDTGTSTTVCELESDNAITRSNDGRADPQGGFWISTMGKHIEPHQGSIWRYWRGELRQLFTGLSIPNAISFTPDGQTACFTDTPTRQLMQVPLDACGWPIGEPVCWLDLTAEALNPDGAVFDAQGRLWVAQWGAGRVACYTRTGQLVDTIAVPTPCVSCPAFGGPHLNQLFCTTAIEDANDPLAGACFVSSLATQGQAEHAVLMEA